MHTHSSRPPVRLSGTLPGFTLVELLIVIAIVGILAALLFPIARNAFESAKSSKCMANLRHIGAAFRLYSADNDGKLPPFSISYPPNKDGYVYLLTPYIPVKKWRYDGGEYWGDCTEGVWRCPSAKYFGYGGGYGVNEMHLMKHGTNNSYAPDLAVRLANIRRSSKLWLIGDAWWPAYAKSPHTWGTVWCPIEGNWSSDQQPAIRHGKNANICFVDGHIESWNLKDLKTNKDDIFGHNSL